MTHHEYRLSVYGGHSLGYYGDRPLIREWSFPFTEDNEGRIREAVYALARDLALPDAGQWVITRFAGEQ